MPRGHDPLHLASAGWQLKLILRGGAHAPSRVVFDALVENLCFRTLDFPFGSVEMRSKPKTKCSLNETRASHSSPHTCRRDTHPG